MSKNEIGYDSPIPKFIYLKIRRRDGVESLTILEEGEVKVSIDGYICRLFIFLRHTIIFNVSYFCTYILLQDHGSHICTRFPIPGIRHWDAVQLSSSDLLSVL